MCGIVGTTGGDRARLQKAAVALMHRGPDQGGIYVNGNVCLGHRRLSVIDLSEGGRQPMISTDDNLVIVYNGEIYNYKELKRALEKKGAHFRSESDTEVIVAGYEKEGAAFFNKLRDMWAFALYDKKRRQIVLSRDYFGIKPLYYIESAGTLAFASEPKALRALGVSLTPNTTSFSTFFHLGYFVAPETCFRKVYALEPGEIITYDLETRTTDRGQLAPLEGERGMQTGDVINGLHDVLLESVCAHYVADVPVGLLFSGGNDSSLVAALSKAVGKTPQTYHLAIEGSADTEYARKIDKELGLTSEFIVMTGSELEMQYEAIWDMLDTPFADVSIIPTSLIYKKIGGCSKVVLSGDGGDEWFGGYRRHDRMASLKDTHAESGMAPLLDMLYSSHRSALQYWNPLVGRMRELSSRGMGDIVDTYLANVGIVDYPLHREALRKQLRSYLRSEDPMSPNLALDRKLYLPNDLLYKTDMASMASSIEARVPFVDREVMTYMQDCIPPELCLSSEHRGKFLLKKVLERYLPTELVRRDKQGFGFSFERYDVPQFRDDVQKALVFHKAHSHTFGVEAYQDLFQESYADIFIKKYPRFAFALVSNQKVFEGNV